MRGWAVTLLAMLAVSALHGTHAQEAASAGAGPELTSYFPASSDLAPLGLAVLGIEPFSKRSLDDSAKDYGTRPLVAALEGIAPTGSKEVTMVVSILRFNGSTEAVRAFGRFAQGQDRAQEGGVGERSYFGDDALVFQRGTHVVEVASLDPRIHASTLDAVARLTDSKMGGPPPPPSSPPTPRQPGFEAGVAVAALAAAVLRRRRNSE